MSAPLSTSGDRRSDSEPHVWQELEEVFAGLSQLARAQIAPQEFYRSLLEEVVRALSAVGGTVWLRSRHTFQPVAQTGRKSCDALADESSLKAHEAILAEVAGNGRVTDSHNPYERVWDLIRNPEASRALVTVERR